MVEEVLTVPMNNNERDLQMNTITFKIDGRITKANTVIGIQGLLVQITDIKEKQNILLGNVYTHRDGRFTINYRRLEVPELFKEKPSFYFKIFDRDKSLIHTSGDVHNFSPGKHLNIKLELPDEVLKLHLSRSLGFEATKGPFLAREKLTTIRQAIELLARPNTPEYLRLIQISQCPVPSIDYFGNLLDDAWDVLNGGVSAEQRFRNMLDLFGTVNSFANQKLEESHTAPQKVVGLLMQRAAKLGPIESFLGHERLIPVILAASLVAGPDIRRQNRYLGIILGQIEAYQPLSMLFEAAEVALTAGDSGMSFLKATLQTLEVSCHSDSGNFFPAPFPSELPNPSIPEDLEQELCSAEAVLAIGIIRDRVGFPPRPRESSETYTIDSIFPVDTCVGNRITIVGSGFTSNPGVVRFTGHRSLRGAPVDISAERWTDREITVVVPAEAGCGPVTLRIPEETVTVSVCDAFLDFSTYRSTTTTANFLGCRPRITRFGIDGDRTCVTIGETVTLSWSVEPDDATVIVSQQTGAVIQELFNGTGPYGSQLLDTSTSGTRNLSISVVNARSTCSNTADAFTLNVGGQIPTLTILGVELTQGIQRFTLATPLAASNNSISLTAHMDTVIRVFVQSDRGGTVMDITRVTGWLFFKGRTLRPINGSPRGSSPFINAKPAPNRNLTDDSLNFLIPAAMAEGEGEIVSIQILTADRCDGFVSIGHNQTISWIQRPALPITIRRIADPWTGDALTDVEAIDLIEQAFDRLPSPRTEIRLHPGVFQINPATAEANYCREGGFYQLALSVAYEHNGTEGVWPDPHESIWIGLFFQTNCTSGGMMSWPWTSTCISQRDAASAAHEIAHCIGMGHTVTSAGEQCEDLFQPVACHRLPNNGDLPDVVFDIRGNTTVPNAVDLMSYRIGFRYPHPDHWEAIRQKIDTRF
jgi:hypothetical protein